MPVKPKSIIVVTASTIVLCFLAGVLFKIGNILALLAIGAGFLLIALICYGSIEHSKLIRKEKYYRSGGHLTIPIFFGLIVAVSLISYGCKELF